MGLIERHVRVYLCDRCGDKREVEGVEPQPSGWSRLKFGPHIDTDAAPIWLCAGCVIWLRKFLEGRKVAD